METGLDYKVESVLPGVHTRLNTLTSELSKYGDLLTNLQQQIIEKMEQILERRALEAMERLLREIGMRFLQGGEALSSGSQTRQGELFPPVHPDDESNNNTRNRQAEGAPGTRSMPPVPESCKQYTLQARHRNLQSVWDEWHGIGEYLNRPIVGGIAKAEELWKSKWRRHFAAREKKLFTRLRSVVTAMLATSDWGDLEAAFIGPCKASLSKMDDYLKSEGVLQKKKPRGKTGGIAQ